MKRTLVLLGVSFLLVVALPLPYPHAPAHSGVPAISGLTYPALPTLPVVVSLLTLSSNPIDLPSTFWGASVSAEATLLPNQGYLFNATPTHIVVWPGGNSGDDYLAPPLNGTLFNPATGGFHRPPTNESQFVNFCRSIQCTAIFQVPGEVNNTAIAASIVSYTDNVLGFHPWAWEIGNEPERWNHTSFPWTQWTNGIVSNETPSAYAWEVNRYISAMRAVDPGIRVLGLPGTGRIQNGGSSLNDWLNATIRLNGPNLSGVAFHDYPGEILSGTPGSGTPLQNLSLFYAAIESPVGLESRITSGRAVIANEMSAVWPGRSPPPLLVTEIGSGLSDPRFHVSNFSNGFPGALSLAAQLTGAMSLNISNLDIFQSVLNTSNSWFDLAGRPRPDYALYADLLSRLGPDAFNASFSGFNQTLYAVGTIEPSVPSRVDLLTVNTNLTDGASFVPQLPRYVSGSPVEVWTWNGTFVDPTKNGGNPVNATAPAPTGWFYPAGLPNSWTLPPQSLALFESYNGPAAPVVATEQGLVLGARWFLGFDGRLSTATTSQIGTFLDAGSHGLGAPPLNVTRHSRNEPFPPSSLLVGTAPSAVSVPFNAQWTTNLTVSPAGAGTLSPDPGWWNASAPLTVNASATPGFVFDRWNGYGLGNFSGSGNLLSPFHNSMTVVVQGWINEQAVFVPGFPVSFQEVGLPKNTPWSVTIHYLGNFTTQNQSTASVLSFLLPEGKWGYVVGIPPDYRANPAAEAVNVTGSGGVLVTVYFTSMTPPPKPFPWPSDRELAIGTGIGLGISVGALIAVVVAWRRRRKRDAPSGSSSSSGSVSERGRSEPVNRS